MSNNRTFEQQQIVGKLHEVNREFFLSAYREHRRVLSHSYNFARRILKETSQHRGDVLEPGLKAVEFFTWDNEYRLTPIGHYNKGVSQVTDRDEFEYLKEVFIGYKWEGK